MSFSPDLYQQKKSELELQKQQALEQQNVEEIENLEQQLLQLEEQKARFEELSSIEIPQHQKDQIIELGGNELVTQKVDQEIDEVTRETTEKVGEVIKPLSALEKVRLLKEEKMRKEQEKQKTINEQISELESQEKELQEKINKQKVIREKNITLQRNAIHELLLDEETKQLVRDPEIFGDDQRVLQEAKKTQKDLEQKLHKIQNDLTQLRLETPEEKNQLEETQNNTVEYKVNPNNSEDILPFNVEKIKEIKIPVVEMNYDKNNRGPLRIDGKEQKKYTHMLEPRRLGSNLYSFYSPTDKNLIVIDVKNPDKELVHAEFLEPGNILINGKKWDSLENKKLNFSAIAVDPETKNIALMTEEKDFNTNAYFDRVIVNDRIWDIKFDKPASSYDTIHPPLGVSGEYVYAFGGKGEGNKLIINNKEWICSRFKQQERGHSLKNRGFDEIKKVKISKKGTVVASIGSYRQESQYREFISIGDNVREKSVWENTFYFSQNIAIDDESGNIAVFGSFDEDRKTRRLIINDIPYEISDNPKGLEYMDFEAGNLIIQYENVLGKKMTEKISLRENSKALQEMKEKKKNEEKAFDELRHLLTQENMPASQIITQLKNVETLDNEVEKNKDLSSRIRSLEDEKIKLQNQNDREKQEYIQKIENAEARKSNMEITLKEVQNILKSAGKATMSSNFKLSPKDMEFVLGLIQNSLDKNK
jgi:predicted DNA-binding ribbon-helix-helix protein